MPCKDTTTVKLLHLNFIDKESIMNNSSFYNGLLIEVIIADSAIQFDHSFEHITNLRAPAAFLAI